MIFNECKFHPPRSGVLILALAWTFLNTMVFANQELKTWRYDVYTGRQFNDLTLPTTSLNDNVVKNPTVLIMYGPECALEATELLNSIRPFGPPDYYLTITMYDYVTYPKYIWYQMDEVDNLYTRYMNGSNDQCLHALYFQTGTRLTRPDIFTNQLKFYFWIWEKMFVHVWIQNDLKNITVKVQQGGQGNPLHLGDLTPWQVLQAKVQISLYITVYDKTSNELIYYENVEPYCNWKTIRLTRELLERFKVDPDWLVEKKMIKNELSEIAKERQRNIAEIQLFNFKQPVLIKRFTDTGHRKMKIPETVYTLIKTFYDMNKDKRVVEKEATGAVNYLTNDDVVPVTMVLLTDDIKERLLQELLEVMQYFCQCVLQGTSVYGIQEYHKGNILRNHVNTPNTDVISALLQIHQESDGHQDWDIEIIGYDGKRDNIRLNWGEMLLYESSTLIHGRPQPYQGQVYVSCLLYYKPISEPWGWERSSNDGHIYLSNGTVAYNIANDNTLTSAEKQDNINTEL